jgi:hypothetical protein
MKQSKQPKDLNQRAKNIVDLATGDAEPTPQRAKNPAAVELGRLGGLVGGKARAKKLTSQERSAIAKKAAEARWKKRN